MKGAMGISMVMISHSCTHGNGRLKNKDKGERFRGRHVASAHNSDDG